jgi:hypothetical protein
VSGAVEVQPDPKYSAGHAVIVVRGAGRFAGSANFRIRRDDFDEGVFGASGWQVADTLLTPDEKSIDGNDLLLHIGPSIVQQIDSGVYYFALPSAELEATMFWPDLPLLADRPSDVIAEHARARRREAPPNRPTISRQTRGEPPSSASPTVRPERAGPSDAAEAKTIVGDAVPVFQPDTEPKPPQIETTTSWSWLLLLVPLVLLGAAGGYLGYRWLYPPHPSVAEHQMPPPVPDQLPEHPPQLDRSPPPSGPNLENMSAIDAIRSGAAPEALLREAERRLQLGGPKTNDALLLLRAAADSGYAPAHSALGRFYDPNLHPRDVTPDPRQAALHYRAAARGGDNATSEARAALKAWLERQAQQNDMYAPLILREFWQP